MPKCMLLGPTAWKLHTNQRHPNGWPRKQKSRTSTVRLTFDGLTSLVDVHAHAKMTFARLAISWLDGERSRRRLVRNNANCFCVITKPDDKIYISQIWTKLCAAVCDLLHQTSFLLLSFSKRFRVIAKKISILNTAGVQPSRKSILCALESIYRSSYSMLRRVAHCSSRFEIRRY